MTKPHPLILSLIILTLITCSHSVNLPPFPSVSDLPYQAHSFNEVGYLRQLLRRGVKYFKIDISLANRESCSKNSNWNQTQKCYRTNQYAEEYCCLALRGDTSGRDSFDYEISTLDNFIDLVENHAATYGVNKLLLFAINWQFDFEFSNQMVENSIYRLAKLMEKYPLINFGFGTDDFIFEYDRICRNAMTGSQISQQPLKKLNQQACNEKRKFISSSKFFLQSGGDSPSDPRDYYGRYRNFNTYYKDIINRCNHGFPAWVKKHPEFPLIFWEPSDQQQIQLVIETFLSDKCRLLHGRDIKGLAITSNIDPQVFEFYLKRVNLTVSTNPMVFYPNKDKIPLDYPKNLLTKMQVNATNFLILGQENNTKDSPNGVNLELVILGNDITTQKVQQVKRVKLNQSKGTVRIVGGKSNMIVVQKPLQDVEDGTVNLTLFNQNLQQVSDPQQLDRFVQISSYDGFYYILRRTINPTVFNILKTADFTKTSIIASFSLVIQKARNVESLLVMQDSIGQLRYFLSGNVNKQVWVGEVRTNNIYKSAFIAYGTNSKLFLKENGMIALTTQNGSCNSGYEINNGEAPLCGIFKYPDFKEMTSTQTTITLVQTTVDNLMDYMMKELNDPVTPCTQKFVHSKVFNGRNVNTVDIWGRLFFVSEYVHISEQGMLNTLFCGASNYERLPSNKKGLLGSIWSRGNVGQQGEKQTIKIEPREE